MTLLQAIVLGSVEGLTEFLPVSSTGHLTVTESILGIDVAAQAVTAFTAVIQLGAILAVLVYFRGRPHATDHRRAVRAGPDGRAHRSGLAPGLVDRRRLDPDRHRRACREVGYRGPAPQSVGGRDRAHRLIGRHSLHRAARAAAPRHGERDASLQDVVAIGVVQCVALVPGVSRSGATISAGLLRGLDRVTATRLSFFLSMPALVGAGALELPDALSGGVGVGPTIVGTAVAFVVAYASIAWLLRFVARHSIAAFASYRVALGVVVLALVAAGVLKA